MAKYILITGAREYPNLPLVREKIADEITQEHDIWLMHGTARGVDQYAANCAKEYGISVIDMPALWTKYGRAAGPLRNQQMVDFMKKKMERGNEVICLAFPLEPRSPHSGTRDCLNRIEIARLPAKTFPAESQGKD